MHTADVLRSREPVQNQYRALSQCQGVLQDQFLIRRVVQALLRDLMH